MITRFLHWKWKGKSIFLFINEISYYRYYHVDIIFIVIFHTNDYNQITRFFVYFQLQVKNPLHQVNQEEQWLQIKTRHKETLQQTLKASVFDMNQVLNGDDGKKNKFFASNVNNFSIFQVKLYESFEDLGQEIVPKQKTIIPLPQEEKTRKTICIHQNTPKIFRHQIPLQPLKTQGPSMWYSASKY